MPTTPTTQSPSPLDTMHDLNPSWSRITRQPGSTIQFASFDPGTATGDHTNASAFRKLTLNEELCRPKRVVIETTPDGRCTWRFVPNARREEGLENEGVWPRVVDVCGELKTLTHDQWDVYKLDRDFDCLVRLPPHHASVTRSASASHVDVPPKAEAMEESPLENQTVRFKRRLSDSVSTRRLSGSNSEGKRKKVRATADDSSSSSSSEDEGDEDADEEEVSGMVIDEEVVPKRHQQSERLKKVRENKEEARRKRREWNAQRREKMGLGAANEEEDENMMSCTEIPNPSLMRAQSVGSPFAKRKVDSFSDEGDVFDESDASKSRFKTYERTGSSKRTRTVSPVVTKRAVEIRRNRRVDTRKEELERRAKARSQAIHENEMKKLYEEAAEFQPPPPINATNDTGTDPSSSSSEQSSEQPNQEVPMDEEARRQAALEESRRKIAELEKDKHLWEEQARKRAAKEAEEKTRAEAARKARAASQAASVEQEKDKENARRRAAETEQRVRDAAAAEVRTKRMHARNAAQRDARAWISRGWTARRALERYMAQCDAFDALNFFKGDVIVFETVPWPVLMRPSSFGVEDIDWTAVETFFRQVRTYLTSAEFMKLVEKSHKRFHPDRWRSRRVLQCVEDEEEKECLEIAANTVAQALTPLWQEVTGR